jgi:hypothetical protein
VFVCCSTSPIGGSWIGHVFIAFTDLRASVGRTRLWHPLLLVERFLQK